MTAYHRPATLADALRLHAATPGARYLSGGTDLLVRVRDGREQPAALISLRGIPGLARIEEDDRGGLRIGALTRVADIAAYPGLAARFGALAEAAAALGSVQIRNLATIGGNLMNASPCADLPPALLVHDAVARVEGPAGARELPVEKLFRGPGATALADGEILTAIVLAAPATGARSTFLKKGRVAMDLSLANAAVLLALDGSRCTAAAVAAGAVAPRPVRLRTVEAALAGQAITPALVAEARALAGREVLPISDLRASADYRRTITGVLVARAIGRLVEGAR